MRSVVYGVLLWSLSCATATAGPACDGKQKFDAADLSTPVNKAFVDKMKAIGVGTIIRYYDLDPPTVNPRKVLSSHEIGLIRDAGLSVAVVFQHNSRDPRRWTIHDDPRRDSGVIDANRAIVLAQQLGQPAGSTIYFGTDGFDDNLKKTGRRDWADHASRLAVNYFKHVAEIVTPRGFDVGVYGSGLMCRTVLGSGHAKFCWLANATSWPESKEYAQTNDWALKQFVHTPGCGGRDVDLNVANPSLASFGQWKP